MSKIKLLVLDCEAYASSCMSTVLSAHKSEDIEITVKKIVLKGENPALTGYIIKWLFVNFNVLFTVNRYDAVLSANVFISLFYCFMRSVFGKRLFKPKHILINVGATRYVNPKNIITAGLLRFLVSSVDVILCYATSTIEFWKQIGYKGELGFILLNVNDRVFDVKSTRGNYIAASGMTHRDYGTLLKAMDGIPVELVIRCSDDDKSFIECNFKQKCRILTNVPIEKHFELISQAKIVVVPIKKTRYHAGQTVLIEAMAMGKAVIAARSKGTEDYLDDKVNGLFYEIENYADLRSKIKYLLDNEDVIEKLEKNAREKAISEFSEKALADRLFNTVRQTLNLK